MSPTSRLLTTLACLFCLSWPSLAPAAQGQLNPYDQQTLPAPVSPYPEQMPGPHGGNQPGQQQGYPPTQQQGYPPVQQPPQGHPPSQQAPAGQNGSRVLNDVLGHFRLALPPDAAPGGVTYNFALTSLGAQVTIMSLAQPQALASQQQNFTSLLPQMGGRLTDQRQISLGGRPAELLVAVVHNPQSNTQMIAYNVFVHSLGLWVQVMGPAQAQAQVQQATNQVLQGLAMPQ